MKRRRKHRLGRIVCTIRGYTVVEALEDHEDGVVLVGFRVFGEGIGKKLIYAGAEEALAAIDELRARSD